MTEVLPPVVQGLLRKRDDLYTRLYDAEKHLAALKIDIGHVEATLAMFAPDIERPIKRRRQTRADKPELFRPSELSRIVLTLLRHRGPMTRRDITLAVMEQKGLNPEDARAYGDVYERVRDSLKSQRERGTVAHDGAKVPKWGIVE